MGKHIRDGDEELLDMWRREYRVRHDFIVMRLRQAERSGDARAFKIWSNAYKNLVKRVSEEALMMVPSPLPRK
jgi:hypothetical protein